MICSSSVCDLLPTTRSSPPTGREDTPRPTGDLRQVEMLRRQSSSVIRLTASHISRPHRYIRHQPLSVRSACRPTSRSSHHPTNLPQIYPRSSSPSRKNSTLSSSSSRTTGVPSRRMRFVRRFVETVPPYHLAGLMLGRPLYQVWFLERIFTFNLATYRHRHRRNRHQICLVKHWK